jgi:hypothetical protein
MFSTPLKDGTNSESAFLFALGMVYVLGDKSERRRTVRREAVRDLIGHLYWRAQKYAAGQGHFYRFLLSNRCLVSSSMVLQSC